MIVKNIGSIDKVIRIVLGLALLSLVFIGPKSMWGLVGIILIATGFMSFCPLYRIIGVNSIGENSRSGSE